MPFIGDCVYRRSYKEESFVGRPVYILTEPFLYYNDKAKKDYKIICELGFKTDFASIPEWIGVDPKGTLWRKAAVIHDKACILAREKERPIDMKEADAFFYYAMKECGASLFTRMFFWTIVRINHIVQGRYV
jgi:hypothetical protein